MKSQKHVPETLHAYIIPTDDAHQVSLIDRLSFGHHACAFECLAISFHWHEKNRSSER